MPSLSSGIRGRASNPKINSVPSPILAIATPWLMVILLSFATMLPFIGKGPSLPPLGFLALVAWLQMRPGLFPVWAGLPLGLIDDLLSGQPFGSAVLLWSLVTIVLDIVDVRFPWRGFLQNWFLAAVITAVYLLAAALLATGAKGLSLVGWQIAFAIAIYPIMGWLVGQADRFRLRSFRQL